MAPVTIVKNNFQKFKKKQTRKINLVFDEAKRRDFLTGFHKRKLQRKKDAKEKLDADLKLERKRLKTEAKESYKKLVQSYKPIPELETLLKEEYQEDDVTVRIEELSTDTIAKQSNWIGVNRPRVKESDLESESEPEPNQEIPGMELTNKPKVKKEKPHFESEREVKRLLKKEATKAVKKSKIFQKKNKLEKQKQKKKSIQVKKLKEKSSRRKKH